MICALGEIWFFFPQRKNFPQHLWMNLSFPYLFKYLLYHELFFFTYSRFYPKHSINGFLCSFKKFF